MQQYLKSGFSTIGLQGRGRGSKHARVGTKGDVQIRSKVACMQGVHAMAGGGVRECIGGWPGEETRGVGGGGGGGQGQCRSRSIY